MLKKGLLSIVGGIVCTILFYLLPAIYFYGYNNVLLNQITQDFQKVS